MEVDLENFHSQVLALQDPALPSGDERYSMFGALDPYPEIPPALLNAGHIASYAIMTGMIEPFEATSLTKPATYLVPLEGECRYIDEYGKRQAFYLGTSGSRGADRDSFELSPNSICYVTLKSKLRMPSYIAGRFNLLIRDVYRGLLVGTGPLVDPGFVGHLSIPIHNFTDNKYPLRADEGFVYFEFTKLSGSKPSDKSSRPTWLKPAIGDQPPFPGSKRKRRNIDSYLEEATGGLVPRSAVSRELQQTRAIASQAKRRLDQFQVVGVVGLLLAVAALGYAGFEIVQSTNQVLLSAQESIASTSREMRDVERKLEALERRDPQSNEDKDQLLQLRRQVDVLQQEIESIRR